jgi:hypothetical protein
VTERPDPYTPSLESISALIAAGDWSSAYTGNAERIVRACLALLAEEGFALVADGELTNALYLREAAAAHLAALSALKRAGRPPSTKALMAAELLGLQTAALYMMMAGTPAAEFESAKFSVLNGSIGHASALLWGESVGVYAKAARFDDRRNKDRNAQRATTDKRISWQTPALTFAIEEYGRDSTISDRQLARQIRAKFRKDFDNFPEVERVTAVVSGWRRSALLPKRMNKS